MNNISNQAKDDVSELLNEIVVSPISTDINEQLNTVKESIEELKKQAESINSIKGLVTVRPDKKYFEGMFDELSTKLSSILSKCKNINTLSKISNEFSVLDSKIVENHQESKQLYVEQSQHLLGEILKYKESIESINEKYDKIGKLLQNITNKTTKINDDIIYQTEKETEIDAKIQSLTTDINNIKNQIENDKIEIHSEINRFYKNDRNSLIIVIILSILNLFGIAVFLIMNHFQL